MKDTRDSSLKLTLILCAGMMLNLPGLAAAPNTSSPAADWREQMRTLGTLHDDPLAQPLQKLKLYLAYMHQFASIQGKDRHDQDFSTQTEEIRRFWVGAQGDFLNHFSFKAVSQISNDRHNYPGGDRQFGHETFRSANITYHAEEALGLKQWDRLSFGYGRRSGRMADEWQRSATHINTLERSPFSNKLWLSDREKGNPLAVWIKGTRDNQTLDLALFSGTYHDWIGGWEDSLTYYLSYERDLSNRTGLDRSDLWLSFYYQDGAPGEDRLANGNEWASAFVTRWEEGRWAMHTTLGFGDNGAQSNSAREGHFWGLVLMPMYTLVEAQQKLVFRYQYQNSDQPEGIRLNSRYARLAEAKSDTLDLNSGRGDSHHSFYLGYNYYFNGDRLKLVSGIEWESLASQNETLYEGWTLGTSLRILF